MFSLYTSCSIGIPALLMNKLALVILGTGILVRVFLWSILTDPAITYLTTRIEVLSPITTFPRLVEGKFLLDQGIDPYVSGYFKLNPITASLVFPILDRTGLLFWTMVACNTFSASLLISAVGTQYAAIAAITFFLNPYTIVSELGLSVESVDILFVSLFVWAGTRSKLGFASLALSLLLLAKPISPLAVIPALALVTNRTVLVVILSVLAACSTTVAVCYMVAGQSMSFFTTALKSLIFISPDLEPTMGYAWNLFSLMFEDSVWFFRGFVFCHLFLLAVPMYWRFRKMLAQDGDRNRVARFFVLMVAAILLYQPYPTGIQYSTVQTLLVACSPRFHDKMSRIMSSGFIFGQLFASAVAPLWLERNTGNSNVVIYLGIVSTFIGMLAIGQSLRATRLAGYTLRTKKVQ